MKRTAVTIVLLMGTMEYNIPMYANAWLQQPGCPRPGEYPSGGPVPQVNDIWRFGTPSIDYLAPEILANQDKGTIAFLEPMADANAPRKR